MRRLMSSMMLCALVAAAAGLGCEFDVQIDPGEDMAGASALQARPDDLTTLPAYANRLVLAVDAFADQPPFLFKMAAVFGKNKAGQRYIVGWTRWISPHNREAQGDPDWFVLWPESDEFEIMLEPAENAMNPGAPMVTIELIGRAVNTNFFCGVASVETLDGSDVRPGGPTFAAQRLGYPFTVPDDVVVDCGKREVPAF